jgi:hypothetical protein
MNTYVVAARIGDFNKNSQATLRIGRMVDWGKSGTICMLLDCVPAV